MKIGEREAGAVLGAALDSGISLLDTADVYGASEEMLGALLGSRRSEVVLATKFGADAAGLHGPDWGARGSRSYVRRAVEDSLRRLRTDWIDLYQLHFPDPTTPIEETLSALSDLVHEGKVRYIGCSNFSAAELVEAGCTAREHSLFPFVSVQNEYNLMSRGIEREVVPVCERLGVGVIPYYPLANGLLTGKYRKGELPPPDSRISAWGLHGLLSDESLNRVEELEVFAADRGIELLDLALSALMARPYVSSVIAGATTPEQVRRNVRALKWRPSATDLDDLDALTAA